MSAVTYQLLGYHETPVRVRFGEVDHYGYLWHGNVLAYFECVRVDLARAFNLLSADLMAIELILPMLEATCVYKNPAFEDEELIVQGTALKPSVLAPFLTIIYRAVKAKTRQEVFRGRTRQVFMQRDGRLITRLPEIVRTRLAELWGYLEKAPSWPDAREIVRSLANVGAEHVVYPS
jgi:acyl-CoA thioester hydrolase